MSKSIPAAAEGLPDPIIDSRHLSCLGEAMKDAKSKLLDAADRLGQVRNLVEAIYMAAADIGDKKCTRAIQEVCGFADDRIDQVAEIIESVRGMVSELESRP